MAAAARRACQCRGASNWARHDPRIGRPRQSECRGGRRIKPRSRCLLVPQLRCSRAYAHILMASLRRRTIVSVGYEGRSIEDLVAVLTLNAVDIVVDVRLTPISRKRGFSKTALSAALSDASIEYRHEANLGNPKDNRDAFRRGLRSARTRYLKHLANGATETLECVIDLTRSRRVALLCFERAHSECHRSCIIERVQNAHPGLTVVRT